MASDKSFVEFIVDQVNDAGLITSKFMFGEYGLYCNGKVVAFICDNHLFVKPTETGRSYIGNVLEAPFFPGGNLYFLIDERVEDREWIAELIRITHKELPEPKPKKKNSK